MSTEKAKNAQNNFQNKQKNFLEKKASANNITDQELTAVWLI